MVSHHEHVQRVLRKQRNADKKVWRVEHEGIRIRNTDENPHAKPADIRAMSPRELRAHEKRLDQFRSRKNQYVRGQDGQPIRRSTWEHYQALESANNAIAIAIESAIGSMTLPGSDTTVETLLALRERLPQSTNKQERIYQKINRGASSIEGQKAAEELVAQMKRKQSTEYVQDVVERRLNSIRAALTYSGNIDMVDRINKLSLPQQQALVEYSNFGEIAALNINSPKYSSDGNIRDDWEEEDVDGTDTQDPDEIHNNLARILKWVKDVNAVAGAAAPGRVKRARKRKS